MISEQAINNIVMAGIVILVIGWIWYKFQNQIKDAWSWLMNQVNPKQHNPDPYSNQYFKPGEDDTDYFLIWHKNHPYEE